MPAASAKPEKQASVEGPDASKQFLVTIDKKIRNLEKRKVKLDLIREKIDRGEELNADQQEAVSKYDGVILNLEFVRDLHKQYAQFLQDMEKDLKKAKKRERMENRAQEQKRLQEILSVQRILDAMGSDTAREDFTNGTNGAIKLTEEQLNSLDELYKLVCPSNEEETAEVEFSKQLVSASNHFLNLLERKDKKVINTTYKSLRELLTTIEESGYLDSDVTETPAVESVPNEEAGAEEEEAVEEVQDPVNQNGVHDEENSGLNPIGDMGLISDHTEVSAIIPDPMLSSQLQDRVGDTSGADIVDDSFFAATPAFPTKLSAAQRPPNEIVSSVQGNFNFLQDSEIDPESPHMDPAVLAVHPMSTHHKQQQPDLTQSTLSQTQQQTYQSMLDKPISQQQQQQSSQASDYSPQAYGQSLMSQSLQDSSLSQETPDVPQPIPMPNQSPDSQKKFTMNPGAPVFHSIYSKSSSEFPNSENQEDGDDKNEDGDDFQESSGFSSRNSGYNKNRGRGGNRGNVSNGYQQRGGRGGQYGNSRGGYNNSGRGSGRGSYQGYNPRNDYRASEGSYNNQGYNGGSSSGGYQGNKNSRGRGAYRGGAGGAVAAEGGGGGGRGGGSGGRGGTGTGSRGNYAKTAGYNQQ